MRGVNTLILWIHIMELRAWAHLSGATLPLVWSNQSGQWRIWMGLVFWLSLQPSRHRFLHKHLSGTGATDLGDIGMITYTGKYVFRHTYDHTNEYDDLGTMP